jgi:hypothetical protein
LCDRDLFLRQIKAIALLRKNRNAIAPSRLRKHAIALFRKIGMRSPLSDKEKSDRFFPIKKRDSVKNDKNLNRN